MIDRYNHIHKKDNNIYTQKCENGNWCKWKDVELLIELEGGKVFSLGAKALINLIKQIKKLKKELKKYKK